MKQEPVRTRADLIEAIANSSDNNAFRSPLFRKALAYYRKNGSVVPDVEIVSIDELIGNDLD